MNPAGDSGRRGEQAGMETAGLLPAFIGARAYDCEGARLGHVADVLFDAQTQRPDWLLLVLAREGGRFVHVPARGARHRAGGVHLTCVRDAVRSAPAQAGPPYELGRGHAGRLAAHYGIRGVAVGPWRGLVEPSALVDDRVRMAG